MAKKTSKTTGGQSDAEKDIVDAEVLEETSADDIAKADEAPDADAPVEPAEPDRPKDIFDSAENQDDDVASPEADAPIEEAVEPAEGAADAPEMAEVIPDEPLQDPQPVVVEKRVGFVPVFLGGVVAAAIGFGAAVVLFPDGLPLAGQADPFEVETNQRLRDQAADITALKAALAKAADQDELKAALTNLNNGLSVSKSDLERLGATVGGFDARLTDLEKRPLTEAISPAAIAAYEREVKALQEAVAAQRDEAETMEDNARVSAQQALGRSALTRVVSALDSGEPFRPALVDLTSAFGISAPEALAALADEGVPTRTQLQDGFPVAARAALATARKANQEADGGSRLGTFLKNQLGARSVAPRDGEDPDAVLSRAEAALREGRLEAALHELTALPETAAGEMAGWVAMAQTRADALAAAETLAQSLNSN